MKTVFLIHYFILMSSISFFSCTMEQVDKTSTSSAIKAKWLSTVLQTMEETEKIATFEHHTRRPQKRSYTALKNQTIKSYECGICPLVLQNPEELVKHLKTHKEPYTPYKCKFCTNSLGLCDGPHKFMEHLNSHSGNTPFKCSKCRLEFKRKQDKIRHQYSHERKYTCRWCAQNFIQQNKLSFHIAQKHSHP